MSLPPFESLPIDKQGPELNAWGLYGPEDQLGRLNLITPEVIKKGAATVEHGLVINLNLPLSLRSTNPMRAGLEHTIIAKGNCADDHVAFNTQTSSQWDGFRHFPYQDYPEKGQHRFYNGMTYEEAIDRSISRNGIQNFIPRGITSRAHLLDVPRYLEQNGLPNLDLFTVHTPISVETLQACAESQGTTLAPGDILLVRTGFADTYIDLPDDELVKLGQRPSRQSVGVKVDYPFLKWLWDSGTAAIVSDCPAVEASDRPSGRLTLHEVGLAGWGLPLGELFDLRELARECERLKRWTFFFTSMPLYVDGGIASPPNAQAIL